MIDLDEIQTPRLTLSRMSANDLDNLTRMHLDPRVMATLGGVRSAETTRQWLEHQLDHWRQYGYGLWLARERETGQFAGRGGLHRVEINGREEVEVGYSFLADYWGCGLATELVRASIHAAFTILNIPNLVCFTPTTNFASQRVMQKAGFRYERDCVYKDMPHVLYRLRRADGADEKSRETER